jgi:heme exporter protein C
MMIVFIIILPRMTDSLHPGSGGNPGFNVYDLDRTMRLVFYPAIIGWALLALWIAEIRVRIHRLRLKQEEK